MRQKTSIRRAIRKALNHGWTKTTLQEIAKVLNPKIRGWINYYGKFFKWRLIRIFDYLDGLIQRWIANKYKLIAKAKTAVEYKRIKAETPDMFYHERLGLQCPCLLDYQDKRKVKHNKSVRVNGLRTIYLVLLFK